MFYCENCGELVERHQPVNSVVVERRQKTYENEILIGKEKGEKFETKGWEIVKEKKVCPKCCIALTGKDPQRKTDPRINISKRVIYVNEQPQEKVWTKKVSYGGRNFGKTIDKKIPLKPDVQTIRKLEFIKN